jgi:uncharacterized membrane protein
MDFFTSEQKKQILKEISEAELDTSGEIRVHIENHCKSSDAMVRGVELFHRLHMNKTAQRNGVLFYLAVKDKKFAIVGDEGINNKLPADFWDVIKTEMSTSFKEGRFTEGLCKAIDQAGKQLKSHFPYQKDDKNELSDEISFNDN